MDLSKKIEAILFYKGEPVSKSFLSKTLGVPMSELEEGIDELKNTFSDNRGVTLIEKENEISLGTSPDVSSVIEAIEKEDIEKELTPAALETLSVILYRSPVSRSEIDFIRGVNSTFILRTLLIRGLVDRKPDPKDKRSYLYEPSVDLLAHLGISNVKEVPRFGEITKKIEDFYNKDTEDDEDDTV